MWQECGGEQKAQCRKKSVELENEMEERKSFLWPLNPPMPCSAVQSVIPFKHTTAQKPESRVDSHCLLL